MAAIHEQKPSSKGPPTKGQGEASVLGAPNLPIYQRFSAGMAAIRAKTASSAGVFARWLPEGQQRRRPKRGI